MGVRILLILLLLCSSVSAFNVDTTHIQVSTANWINMLGQPRRGVVCLPDSGHYAFWSGGNGHLYLNYVYDNSWLDDINVPFNYNGSDKNHAHLSDRGDTVLIAVRGQTFVYEEQGASTYLVQIESDTIASGVTNATATPSEYLANTDTIISVWNNDGASTDYNNVFVISADNGNTWTDTLSVCDRQLGTVRVGLMRGNNTLYAYFHHSYAGVDSVAVYEFNRTTVSWDWIGTPLVSSFSRGYSAAMDGDTIIMVASCDYSNANPRYLYYAWKHVDSTAWAVDSTSLGSGRTADAADMMGIVLTYVEASHTIAFIYQDYWETTPTSDDSVLLYARLWDWTDSTLGTSINVIGHGYGTGNEGGVISGANFVPASWGKVFPVAYECDVSAASGTDMDTYLTWVTILPDGTEITSLPYTISTRGQYYLNSNLSATDDGITISADSVYLDLNGFDIEFGTGNAASAHGFILNAGVDTVTITNGSITHGATAEIGVDSLVQNCDVISMGTNDYISLLNLQMSIKGGKDCHIIRIGAGATDWCGMLNVVGCRFSNYVTWYDRRDYYEATCFYYDDASPANLQELSDLTYYGWDYSARVAHCTVTVNPHTAIWLNQGVFLIDSNVITVSARNDKYTYPSAANYEGSSNAYGISAGHILGGTRFLDNIISADSAHEGGEGIIIESSAGTSTDTIKVIGNDVDVFKGFDAYYGYDTPIWGFRLRGGTVDKAYILVENNDFKVYLDTAHATNYRGTKGAGSFITLHDGDNRITYKNNHSEAVLVDGFPGGVTDATPYALVLEAEATVTACSTKYNNLKATAVPYKYGMSNGSYGVAGYVSVGDTLNWATPHITDEWNDSGAVVIGYYTYTYTDLYLLDAVFQNTVSNRIFTSGSGTAEGTLQATLTVTVNDGSNPISGATVSVENAYGTVATSGSTNGSGIFTGVVNYRYESNTTDSAAFNDFLVIASSGGITDTTIYTVDWNTKTPTVSLTGIPPAIDGNKRVMIRK